MDLMSKAIGVSRIKSLYRGYRSQEFSRSARWVLRELGFNEIDTNALMGYKARSKFNDSNLFIRSRDEADCAEILVQDIRTILRREVSNG